MTFRVQKITLSSFRNWDCLEIEPDSRLTLITGPNAAGKTNVVEAIQLVTAVESFRKPSWAELVGWGADEATVSMQATGEGRERAVSLRIGADGRRTYRVNGSVKRRIGDVAGELPAVIFTPDDLRMVKGSAEMRREALDEIGSQLSGAYRDIRGEFDKALRQRNAILRSDRIDESLLGAWTERFCELGAALSLHRMRLFNRAATPLSEAYASVSSGERLEAEYSARWWGSEGFPETRDEALEAIRSELEQRAIDERARRTTIAGPHRDDVIFTIDGHDARSYASQGQQRTVALAWKMAEVSVVKAVSGKEPLLLLDDVMSELDSERRDALATVVSGAAQTFITTTNLGYFSKEFVGNAKVVDLGGS